MIASPTTRFSILMTLLLSCALSATVASVQDGNDFSSLEISATQDLRDRSQVVKCGTSALLELKFEAQRNPLAAAAYARLIIRPELPFAHVTPDQRFRIHFATEGTHAVDATSTIIPGVPDFVYHAGIALMRAHVLLIDSLGFDPPASDAGVDGPEIDAYIMDLINNYGETVPEFDGHRGPAYLRLENDFVGPFFTHGVEAVRVSAAHEYFHAVQFNIYSRFEDIFFFETSSTWFEDFAYDEVNDYLGYLPAYFRTLFLPLNTRNRSHEYGNAIWLHYLVKRFDIEIIRQLWEQIETLPALLANDSALESRGLSLGEAFSEFGLWMYFTGYRADTTRYFPEGASYPLVRFDRREDVQPSVSFADSIPNLATRFYRLVNFSEQMTARHFSDEPGRWTLTSIDGNHQDGYNVQKADGGAALCVQNISASDTVAVIVSNVSLPSSATLPYYLIPDFRYSLQAGGGCFATASRLLSPRPNPFIPGAGDELSLPVYLQSPSQLKLFVVREDGRLVRRLDLGLRSAGGQQIIWDGRDDGGAWAASGIYILQVIAGDFQQAAKVAVIHP